jgi:ABC-type antimicrobial peptide transport system permease subunit
MTAFAFLAFLLAVTGIFGIISYDVDERTREIGIRMALGAQRGGVIRLLLNRGMALTGIGIAFGIGASLALTRLLAGVLYETRPNDPGTYVLVGVALAMVALCTGFFAVRRISRIEPMAVLRR